MWPSHLCSPEVLHMLYGVLVSLMCIEDHAGTLSMQTIASLSGFCSLQFMVVAAHVTYILLCDTITVLCFRKYYCAAGLITSKVSTGEFRTSHGTELGCVTALWVNEEKKKAPHLWLQCLSHLLPAKFSSKVPLLGDLVEKMGSVSEECMFLKQQQKKNGEQERHTLSELG